MLSVPQNFLKKYNAKEKRVMRKVQIITDSCSDLTTENRAAYNVDYVKMNIVVRGEEKEANLDWALYSPKEMYDIMRGGERITTTQVPATEYINVFTKYLEEGCDIVYISCAGVLSGSINTSLVVAKQLLEKYPDAKIHCIDSLNSCMGEGILVLHAAKLRDEGKTADEIAEIISDMRLTSNQFAAVETLDYLKRAGRVKAASAFFGNLFGVKPIIISDVNGQNFAIKKVKGRQASMDELVNLMKEAIVDADKQTVYVGHADSKADADYLEAKVKEVINPKATEQFYIGPIIGASVGPGTVVLYAFGNKVETVG